ncbi:hypothetical protein TWF192_004504 [Orbilia oligospora]|uniref:Uncharacterized protein n=2 Tax=Orbilia oligospora TaxID=2813651 RepID=A0A6G1MCM1_ORBOL|nr:hypothetical protein TWF679_011158 [Orbilia oligospora]KAF3252705.1 hypothetical protein TWF192_004504 [Orbilia oligospora]
MDKPNAIELQIAHGTTPIPFMVPMKKAIVRQALEEVIRSRANCGSAPVITMYTRTMVIIHWEDWEELVEPGKRYLADLDGSWILHSRARGHGTSIESINMFLRAIERGKSPASLPMPLSQIKAADAKPTIPASTPQKAVTGTEKEAYVAPARPSEQQKAIPRPANPRPSNVRLGYQVYIPRQPSNLNPNSSNFPAPIGPAGMGHGFVNPAVEREVLEELQQQIGTLAVEKPATARQSTAVQPTKDEDKLSIISESDDSEDEPSGGVRLNVLSAPPSAEKGAQDVQELSDVSPETAKTGLSDASKSHSVSPVEEVKKTHTAQTETKKAAGKVTSPQALSTVSSAASHTTHAPKKPVSKEPTPIKASATGTAATSKTFTKAAPFQSAAAKSAKSVDSAPTKRVRYQNLKSDNDEEYSHLEDSAPDSGVGSPPEIVQKVSPRYGNAIGSSGDDEDEDEAYETIEVPGPSSPVSSSIGAIKPARLNQQQPNQQKSNQQKSNRQMSNQQKPNQPKSNQQKSNQQKQQNQHVQRDDKRQKLLKDENRVTFYLIKPQNKDKPIVQDGKGRIFISTSKECCALRLIQLLRKNTSYTRLLILTPAPDMSRYITTDVINPGSRFAQTPFSVVGFEDDVTMTWEHIENAFEDEIINKECPWDQPDVVNDEELETYDYEDDEEEDVDNAKKR